MTASTASTAHTATATPAPARQAASRSGLLLGLLLLGGLTACSTGEAGSPAPTASAPTGAPVAPAGADGTWTESYQAAVAAATAAQRPILIDFTGSDWCPWCQRLHHEVFDTALFKDWAAHHVVLLEADFPESHPQSDALKAQNDQLQHKYQVEGFPTVLVVAADGSMQGQLGYRPDGPQDWITAAVSAGHIR
jgi:thiol:disulfide interchange protein